MGSGCTKLKSRSSNQNKLNLAIKESTPEAKEHRIRAKFNDKKVRWDGGGVILGDASNRAFSNREFREHLGKLLEASQIGLAKHFVKRFPDVSLEVLQEADVADHDPQILQFVAKQFDANWCRQNVWSPYIAQLINPPREIQFLEAKRRQFWIYLKKTDARSALELGLVKSLDRSASKMFQVECHRLEAIAYMMNGQHRQAAQSLKYALTITDAASELQSSKLRLLLGEFFRHQKQVDDWKTTWASAVVQHCRLVKHGLYDPEFWNRAAYLRPAKTKWPEEVVQNATLINRQHHLELKPEANVWAMIGFQNLLRGEGQNAILAFKKAEAISQDLGNVANLRLQQARAMILAGQPGPASALLIRLISQNEGKVIGDRSQAILASMKLQNGGIAQGLNLLQNSVKSIEQWPLDESLRARADYGLALLMRGHESEGLRVLGDAHQGFARAADYQQAHQCLWNIAKYHEKKDNRNQYRAAVAKLSEFEKRAK